MKVSVISLGCKVNQSEGEDILNRFAASGFKQAGRTDLADIIVINTCTVTGEADRKSRKLIYQTVKKKAGPTAIVAVTGCYAETGGDSLRAIPGVDVVIAQHDKTLVFEQIVTHLGRHAPSLADRPVSFPAGSRTRAYLKIQDGCDNRCAYCVVPDARGGPRSLKEDEIIAKAASLAAGGTREIVLTGVNVGKYKTGKRHPHLNPLPSRERITTTVPADPILGDGICNLIKKLLGTSGLARIRLSSIEPEDVTGGLIELLGERRPHLNPLPSRERNDVIDKISSRLTAYGSRLPGAYLCPHLHIPLQSGDDGTLRRMRRRYTAAEYLDIVERVRAACPDVAITTDVIVGFPGETDDEFRNTYRLIEKAGFAGLHVFRYSKRAGTPAAIMPDQTPAAIKAERSEALRELSGRLEAAYRKKFIGRELEVLVEKASGNRLTGTSENYLTVTFDGDKSQVGRMVKVRPAAKL